VEDTNLTDPIGTSEDVRAQEAQEDARQVAMASHLYDGDAPAPDVAMGQPLLQVQGLQKHFPIYGGILRRRVGTVYAVDGVDFDVKKGEIFSLVGESGCGKTTLGRTVLQLLPPTGGKVVFGGEDITGRDAKGMRPFRKRMQIIFQDPFGSLNPRMPVSDIIGEGLMAQGMSDA
jgi:oligopeptide transport system ATP-binding protein